MTILNVSTDRYATVGASALVAGKNGLSAYDVAVANGFVGSQSAWLASLAGATGAVPTGGSAGQFLKKTSSTDFASAWASPVANDISDSSAAGRTLLTAASAAAQKAALAITAGDVSGLVASATTDTTNASNISSGTLSINRFNGGSGASTTTFLRGDGTWATPAGGGGGTPGGTNGQVQYNNAGAFGGFTVGGDATLNTTTGALTVTKTSGVAFAASATSDTTNAQNITSGTLPAARLPAPTVSALGGVKSATAPTHQFVTGVDLTGALTFATHAAADISDATAAGRAILTETPGTLPTTLPGTANKFWNNGGVVSIS